MIVNDGDARAAVGLGGLLCVAEAGLGGMVVDDEDACGGVDFGGVEPAVVGVGREDGGGLSSLLPLFFNRFPRAISSPLFISVTHA